MYLKDSRSKFSSEVEVQNLHSRSREASLELRKLIVTLSTAILGFSFILLIDKKTNIDVFYRWTMMITLICMALTIVIGLFSWYADAKHYYYWGKNLQADTNKLSNEMSQFHRFWTRQY